MRWAFVLLIAFPLVANADLILPGYKRVQHDLVLTWHEGLSEVMLVAYPTRGFGTAHVVEKDAAFSFSSKYSTRIYAVPSDATLPEMREDWLEVPWARAEIPVGEVSAVRTNDPVARLVTKLRVTRAGAEGIEFERLSHRSFDKRGNELGGRHWLPLLLIAGVGIALMVFLVLRRKPVETATGS